MSKIDSEKTIGLKIGKYVKKRRLAMDLTQEQLAALTDVSTNHISSIETEVSNPSYDLLIKLAAALNTTPDYFLLGELHSNNVSSHITYLLKQCDTKELSLIELIVESIVRSHNN